MAEQPKQPFQVRDEAGRTLNYHITPSAGSAETAPILVTFHGWNGVSSAEIHGERGAGMPHWNVVFPMDRWGFNRMGAWFLGEQGNYFITKLIAQMVQALREIHGYKGPISFHGTSMGGFGAAMNGILLRIPILLLDIPQTCLLANVYGRYHKDKLRTVFGSDVVDRINQALSPDVIPEDLASFKRWYDVGSMLDSTEESYRPTILLNQSRFDNSDGGDGNSYLPEQTVRLVNAMVRRRLPFRLDVENRNAHVTRWNFWKAIKFVDEGLHTREGNED